MLDDASAPLCLMLRSGREPDHWQAHWERRRSDVRRAALGDDAPTGGAAIARLSLVVNAAHAPVLLVAQGEACLLVARWAARAGETAAARVAGALLVAPAAPTHRSERQVLPFPTVLVASRNDPALAFERARELAGEWLAIFCDAGAIGAGRAGLGAWPEGERVLDLLIAHGAAREHRRRDDEVVQHCPEAIMAVPA